MNAVRAESIVTDIQSRVPWDDYAALPGVSITKLKELRRSPMHFRHRLLHPKETQPLTLGRAAHCAVLEPERYEQDHAVWTRRTGGGNLAPRNGKWWGAFKASAGERTIITEDENIDAMGMQRAVRANPDAMRLLESGDPEVTLQWGVGGVQCKGRVDWLTRFEGRPALVGLKSARDCRPFQFGRQAANLGYHLQWAFYLDGYKAITGGELPRVFEIVVEPEAPHASVVFEVPDDVLIQGAAEYSALMEQLAECERENSWPGPAPGIQTLSMPAWVYGEMEISYVE